ncbi:MAG: zinc-binding alcohol dehydrogenase family protein [Bacteroidota bacterium]
MKGIAIINKGEQPTYVEDFTNPVANSENQVEVLMKAVALKHLDKMRANGKHYSAQDENWEPKIVGGDGVGILADGKRVYGLGTQGTMAEKSIFDRKTLVAIPDNLDDATAAALPNGVMGSAMALRFRANMRPGSTVLINGATGFTGAIAVQLAKYYGAKKVIATGRNEIALRKLKTIGADEVISLKQADSEVISQLKDMHQLTPIDIVLDYLWGHPAELILSALKGNGAFTHRTCYVTIGEMSGDKILLPSAVLRSTDLQISGSGLGSWTANEIEILLKEILPEVLQLSAEGKLKVEIETFNMKDIESIWNQEASNGRRLVVLM